MEKKQWNIALVGNPNSGKTTLFNHLTGLRQKAANFPGVTVEKFSGKVTLPDQSTAALIDLPGTYSLYPTSIEELIVVDYLLNDQDPSFPDMVIYVADLNNLERHLLLCTQLIDLNIPLVCALSMSDMAAEKGITIQAEKLSTLLGIPCILVNGRTGQGVDALMDAVIQGFQSPPQPPPRIFTCSEKEQRLTDYVKTFIPNTHDYKILVAGHHVNDLQWTKSLRPDILTQFPLNKNELLQLQVREIMSRYQHIQWILNKTLHVQSAIKKSGNSFGAWLDKITIHRIWGPLIFFGILFVIFQTIFSVAEYPMQWIESGFLIMSQQVSKYLGQGWFADLCINGIIPGLGGILVFIPQIALLFLIITLLEESGYMSRVVYIFDRILQKFGMNGRSIVALVSSSACAIPAIMSTRTIPNWKERLITILVAPLISCSARIPVYTLLVGFIVGPGYYGIFNKQGLVFMILYLIGIVTALGAGWIFHKTLKVQQPGLLLLEIPEYRVPHWRNVGVVIWNKVRTFITEAGKIIFIISVILWALASYGPGQRMALAEERARAIAIEQRLTPPQTDALINAHRLEQSWAGMGGRWIEPVIAPLGFDWKIGIALITSFAAREVFVGTMATIYSLGENDDALTMHDKLSRVVHVNTGLPFFNRAVSASLLVFYIFALQCMSTLAVTRRETGSWKWALLQFLFMGLLAYVGSWITYHLFS